MCKSVTDIPTNTASGTEGAIQRVAVGHSPEGINESTDAEGSKALLNVVLDTNLEDTVYQELDAVTNPLLEWRIFHALSVLTPLPVISIIKLRRL